MKKRGIFGSIIAFQIDETSSSPVYRQLYIQLRSAILGGRLAPGSRLPASRVLASELRLSRNTIMAAYESLSTEGYIVTHVGAGAYVCSTLPEDRFLPRASVALPMPVGNLPALSARGCQLTTLSIETGSAQPVPFVADIPAFDAFPLDAWARLMAKGRRQVQPAMLGYADPAGYQPLREMIAQHLRAARFLTCAGTDIVMTSGSQQSLDLLARMLLDTGDKVWIEDPGYVGARSAFIAAGAELVPVPVDSQGLDVAEGVRREPRPRLIFISPSRQYPLGMTMTMARRVELLSFAESCGAWVVEDDYDSEFRYSGAPLPAVQSLDRSGRVIYLGTFSKSLLPSFRLGFLAVPPNLSSAFANAKSIIDRHPPLPEQIALAEFMRTGQFSAHLRRMRQLYAERQEVLITEFEARLHGRLRVEPAESGMHLITHLPDGVDDRAFCDAAAQYGLALRPLSPSYLTAKKQAGLILGYAAFAPRRIKAAVEKLAHLANSSL